MLYTAAYDTRRSGCCSTQAPPLYELYLTTHIIYSCQLLTLSLRPRSQMVTTQETELAQVMRPLLSFPPGHLGITDAHGLSNSFQNSSIKLMIVRKLTLP